MDFSICQPHGLLHSTYLFQLCPRNICTNICLTSKEVLTDSDDRACLASANVLAKGCANHKLLQISEVRRYTSSFASSSLKDNYPPIESTFLCSTHSQQSLDPRSLGLSLHAPPATLVTPLVTAKAHYSPSQILEMLNTCCINQVVGGQE